MKHTWWLSILITSVVIPLFKRFSQSLTQHPNYLTLSLECQALYKMWFELCVETCGFIEHNAMDNIYHRLASFCVPNLSKLSA